MKRLLVTGASGFLGWNVCRLSRDLWEVTGTVGSQSIGIPGVKIEQIDLADMTAIDALFKTVRPDAVMHLAAWSHPADVAREPEASRKVNVDASLRIAERCADGEIPLAFTSTGLVFDGKSGPYTEEDPICPHNLYGEQKAQAEAGILERWPRASVCRVNWMFGPPAPGNPSFVQKILDLARAGGPIDEFADLWATPSSARAATEGMLLGMQKIPGVLHLGGGERVSRAELARLVLRVFGFSEDLVVEHLREEEAPASLKPRDTSLNSEKAMSFGYAPLALEEELGLLRDNPEA